MPIDPKIIQSLIEDKESDLKDIVHKLQSEIPDLEKLDLAGIKKEDLVILLKSLRLKDLIPKLANNDPKIKKLDLTAIDKEGLNSILEAAKSNSHIFEIENISKDIEREEDLKNLFKILRKNLIPKLVNNDPEIKKLDLTAIDKEGLESILKALKFNSYVTQIENLNKDISNKYKDHFRIKMLQNLIIQAADQEQVEVLQKIIDDNSLKGKDLNKITDSFGRNMLYIAAVNNHRKAMVVLMELGLKPYPSNNGLTAFHAAITRGHEEILYFLINCDKGIINNLDKNGMAPIHILAENKIEVDESKTIEKIDESQNNRIATLEEIQNATTLKAENMIAALKLGNADLNLLNKEEETAFFIAAKNSNLPVIIGLSKMKADINKPSKNGNLPILVAIDNGHYDAADLLMKCSADVHEAICLATKNNNIKAIDYLKNKNPDIVTLAICNAASKKEYGSKIIKNLVGKEKDSKEFKDILIKAFKKAAQHNYHEAIPRLLKNIGPDFVNNNLFNETIHKDIISIAAHQGNVEFIEALKKNKFKIDYYITERKTPLELSHEVKDGKKVEKIPYQAVNNDTKIKVKSIYKTRSSYPIITEADDVEENRRRVSMRFENFISDLKKPNISTEELVKIIIEYILRNQEKEEELRKIFKSVLFLLNESAESIEQLQKAANLDKETQLELEMINMKDELKLFYLCNRRLISQFLITAFVVGSGIVKADSTSVVNDTLGKGMDITKIVCSAVGGCHIPIASSILDFFSTAISEARKGMNQYKMNNAVSLLTDPVECSKFAEFVSRKLTLLKAHQIAGDLEKSSKGTVNRIKNFFAKQLGESEKEILFRTMDEVCEKDIYRITKKLTASENRINIDSDLKISVLEDLGYTVAQVEGNKSVLRIELEKNNRIWEAKRLNKNEILNNRNNSEHLNFSQSSTVRVEEVVEIDSNTSFMPITMATSNIEIELPMAKSPTLSPASSSATPIARTKFKEKTD